MTTFTAAKFSPFKARLYRSADRPDKQHQTKPRIIVSMLVFAERKRQRRLKELQSKKQSIEEDSHEESGSDRDLARARRLAYSGQLPLPEAPPPQCNGLPFSSYLDPSGSFELSMGDPPLGTTHDEHLSPDRTLQAAADAVFQSHPTLAVAASLEEADGMPNANSNHSIGQQDPNQNLALPDGASNLTYKRRGSITFVITDHSDQAEHKVSSPESKESDQTHSANGDLKDTIPKCAYHSRKSSVCESIPEEKTEPPPAAPDRSRSSQGSIHGLRLPPPSIRKSGRSMSECSDYQDYSLTPDGKSRAPSFPTHVTPAARQSSIGRANIPSSTQKETAL